MPKRGGLKAAGKRQESATFLQRSFFDVVVQFFVCCSAAFGPNDFRTAEKTMLQCSFCSAALRKLQCNFRFRLWHVAGVGLEGSGLGLAEKIGFGPSARNTKPNRFGNTGTARPGISTKNAGKMPFQAEINMPPKDPENTKKKLKLSPFWVFFQHFQGLSRGSRISAWGVFFRYFSWKFRVRPSRESVAGRAFLNEGLPV